MIEALTRDLISQIMEEQSLSMFEAMDKVYLSKTFEALSNPDTGLYFQSAAYLYDEFIHEESSKE